MIYFLGSHHVFTSLRQLVIAALGRHQLYILKKQNLVIDFKDLATQCPTWSLTEKKEHLNPGPSPYLLRAATKSRENDCVSFCKPFGYLRLSLSCLYSRYNLPARFHIHVGKMERKENINIKQTYIHTHIHTHVSLKKFLVIIGLLEEML